MPVYKKTQNNLLARRQQGHGVARLPCLGQTRAGQFSGLQGSSYAVEYRFSREGLFNEIDGPSLYRPNGERYIAITGNNNNRQLDIATRKCLLQCKSVHAWHADVQNRAINCGIEIAQEISR